MALSEIQVADLRSIPLAVVRRRVLASELARVVPEGCGAVWKFVRAHQLQAGRNVAVYWDGSIRLEVGVELEGALPEGVEVVRSATPAGATVSVMHLGPYGGLGVAHQAIRDWSVLHHRRLAGPNWEVYGHWQDDWNADPSRIRTEVFYQLAPETAGAG